MSTELLSIEIDASPEKGPPAELRIFPAGEFKTKKGKFTFDAESAASTIEEWKTHGVRKFFDYGHKSVDPFGPTDGGKAAAWFSLEVRNGELWAVDLDWTPAAKKAVVDKEWLYLSPTFTHDERRHIRTLINAALTNLPATLEAVPITTSHNGLDGHSGAPMRAIALSMGLPEASSEAEILSAVARDREIHRELCSITGKPNPRDALVHVTSLAANEKALAAKVVELEAARVKAEVEKKVDDAITKLCVPPAERDFAVSLGMKDPLMFEQYMANHREPRVQDKPPNGKKPNAKADTETVALLSRFGMTAEEYETHNAEMVARGQVEG